MNNFVVPFNKPDGITSAELVNLIKMRLRKLGFPRKLKVGHGGTLDKNAEGLMVLGIGKGTKKLRDYLSGSKEYIGEGTLGIETDTYDRGGSVVKEMPIEHIDEDKLKESLDQFKGEIMQTPPVYSALKRDGKRVSDLIREGKEVKLEPRKITIYNLELVNLDLPKFCIKVECSGGTYIRSLIYDIGRALDSCAFMSSLKRVKQGKFKIEEALDMETFTLEDLNRWKI